MINAGAYEHSRSEHWPNHPCEAPRQQQQSIVCRQILHAPEVARQGCIDGQLGTVAVVDEKQQHIKRGHVLAPNIKQGVTSIEVTMTARKVCSRPRWSENQPEKNLPDALPMAPIVMANAAVFALNPADRANGTSWLMTIVPAVVPSAYAIQSARKTGLRSTCRVGTSP